MEFSNVAWKHLKFETLQKSDFLPGATAKKARDLTRWFQLMNFQSDSELDELLSDLERLAAKPTVKTSGVQAMRRSEMCSITSFNSATATRRNSVRRIVWPRSNCK